jgi:hypothetical protein
MRAKKASLKPSGLKPSGQARHQKVEKVVATRETVRVVDAESQRSAENERWIEDMAVLRQAAEELAKRRLATKSTVPTLATDKSFHSLREPFGNSSKPKRNEAVSKLHDSNREHVVIGARETSLVVDAESQRSTENEPWIDDMAVLRWAAEELAQKRMATTSMVPTLATDNSFHCLLGPFGYSSKLQRNEAVRTLYHSNPERVASFLKIAIRDSSPEQRQTIGAELLDSGLVDEAINTLTGAKDKESYSAFSLLFLAAKSGVIQPLVTVIERHPSVDLRLKLIGLLVSSGVPEVLPAFRRLAVSKVLSFELRPAIVDGINQLNIQMRETAASTARSQNLESIRNLGFALAVTESQPKFNADGISSCSAY